MGQRRDVVGRQRHRVNADGGFRSARAVQVASSASWDNSYEVVEFAGQPGETYDIVIRRWSGTDSVWFGVAWTVSGFSLADVVFPFDRLSVARLERP